MVAQVDLKSVDNQQVVQLITAGRSGDLGLQNGAQNVPSLDHATSGSAASTPARATEPGTGSTDGKDN